MIYGIVWLLSDVSLVQLHYLGAGVATKVALMTLIAVAFLAWQVCVRKRPWRFEATALCLLLAVVVWRVSALPEPESPDPEPGWWVGQWVGLPGQSSALFQPFGRQKAASSQSRSASCSGEPLPFRLWIRGIKSAHLEAGKVRPGLCVTLLLVAEPETRALAPALAGWRQRNRIAKTLRVAKGSTIEINQLTVDTVDQWRLDIRHLFQAGSEHEAGHRWSYLAKLPVLLGLVTGDRALMRPAHWRVFSDTGTSHLMAISGSHVSMFAVFVYAVVNWLLSRSTWLTTRMPSQHLALVAGWCGALGYSLLAGFNVPTQRTLVMIGVAVFLKLRGQSILDWRAWWLALVAVTIYDPLAIFDRGAWLSFFAVAIILWVLQGRLRAPGPVKGWVLVQWGIFVGLTPLLVYAFGGFPWISVVANAIAIPLTGFGVVPGAMLAALVLWLDPPGSDFLLLLILGVTDTLLVFLQTMADMGGAGYRIPQPGPDIRSIILTWLALSGVLWWLAPRGVPGKWLASVLVLPVLAGPGFLPVDLPRLTWLPSAARQNFLLDTPQAVWWVFEAGLPSRKRQPLMEEWARNQGYGYRWDTRQERYADWIRHGFLVQRYEKFAPLPGQIHLRPPRLVTPCLTENTIALATDWRLNSLRPSENTCWLRLDTATLSLLLAGDLSRETQLAQASSDGSTPIDALLLTPRSGQTLLAAVLNHFEPAQVVEWPAESSVLTNARPKLEARNILVRDFSALEAQMLAP